MPTKTIWDKHGNRIGEDFITTDRDGRMHITHYDENNNPIKGIPRHPIIEDDVVIYSNATILGRVTIGRGCVVGANIWVTEDMEPNTKKYKKE